LYPLPPRRFPFSAERGFYDGDDDDDAVALALVRAGVNASESIERNTCGCTGLLYISSIDLFVRGLRLKK
jgi:hypothetical protein